MYDFTGLQKLNNQLGQKVGYKGQLGTKQMARLAQAQSSLPDPRLTDLEVSRQHMLNQQLQREMTNSQGGMGDAELAKLRSVAEMEAEVQRQQQAYEAKLALETAEKQLKMQQSNKTALEKMQEQAQMAALQKQIQAGVPKMSFSTATPLAAPPASFVQNTYTPPIPGLSAVPSNAPPSSSGRRSSGSGKSSGGSSGSSSGPREWVTTGTGGLPGLQNTGGAMPATTPQTPRSWGGYQHGYQGDPGNRDYASGGALGGSGPLNLVKGVTGYNDRMGPAKPGVSIYDYTQNPANTAKPFSSPQSTGYANSTTYNAPKPSNTAIAGQLAVKEKKKSM